jgi:glycosyltransferase involved in cell wall biosynthesis
VAVLATNNGGDFGVPGGGMKSGETREVTLKTAAWLQKHPQFTLAYDAADLPLRDDAGAVKYLGYFGPVDSRFGYGGAGISILRALTRLGVEAQVSPHYNNDHKTAYTTDLPTDARSQLVPRPFIPQVTLVHCLPNDLPRAPKARNVAWTMWETSQIPSGQDIRDARGQTFGNWADHLNRHAERLIVPCQHNAEVFAACGVNLPTTVLPYGLDTEIWPLYEREERDSFLVVQYGDLTSRKGVEEAIQAFKMAFPQGDYPQARLVLKTQGGILKEYIARRYGDDSRILVVDETWTRAQLVQLLHMADCFIWLSRGEGFGLPPLQAALTGLPVVMTTHSGMSAYYKPQFFYGVRNDGMSTSPMGGEWYEPDVAHAAEQLRKVYENRTSALKRGKSAATYVRNNFSLEAFANRLGTFLETL